MDKRFVKILILVALGLAVTVDAQDGCAPEVRVRKNTIYTLSSKKPNISCPVRYCEKIPTITWSKLSASNTNEYIPVTESDLTTITQELSTVDEKIIISYLSFKCISNSVAGLYTCVAAESNFMTESHRINVSVSDTILKPVNRTVSHDTPSYSSGGLMLCIIIIACYAVLIPAAVLILISSLRVHRCTRKGTPVKHSAEFTTAVFSLVPPTPTSSEHEDDLTV